ncbi:hypothetical protein AF72_04070 [Xylella taiwanensis]|uniref:Uncharacterized protein n=1 Tax=Xylella taiwanensis TaxID=1444770 RepID=Z9JL79_9GAMM|nr:hypothetical protein AF72_04070 [Xylella taiwanensis]
MFSHPAEQDCTEIPHQQWLIAATTVRSNSTNDPCHGTHHNTGLDD